MRVEPWRSAHPLANDCLVFASHAVPWAAGMTVLNGDPFLFNLAGGLLFAAGFLAFVEWSDLWRGESPLRYVNGVA